MKKQIVSILVMLALVSAIVGIGTASTGNQNNTTQSVLNNSISVNGSTASHPDISSVPTGIYGTDTQLSASTTSDYKTAITASTTGYTSDGFIAHTTGSMSDGVDVSTTGSNSYGVYTYTTGPGSYGVTASTQGSTSHGVYSQTNGPSSYGVAASTTGDSSDGVYTHTIGSTSHGVIAVTNGPSSYGLYGATSGDNSDGVIAVTTGANAFGLVGYTYGPGAWGVYANSDKSYGLYASTNVPNGYGIYTPNYIYAKGTKIPNSDVAEYMPVTENVTPGTVMVIGEDGKLQPSTTANDTKVAGIVSTSPGVTLGTNNYGNPGEQIIAVAGRVPCKVDATKAPIHAGDLLTTSDKPGYAMKATDPKIGTILGKAMGTLESGTGTIEVIVTLQ